MKNTFLALLLSILCAGCSQTKFVPKGSYLLTDVEVEVDNKKIGKSSIEGVLQQKPVRKIFGMPFSLWVYDWSDSTGKTKFKRWLNKTLQKIGEPPTVFDSSTFTRSINSVDLYLKSKGYYKAVVVDTLLYTKRFVKAKIKIETNEPYYLRSYSIVGPDSAVVAIVKRDSTSSLLHPGMVFNSDVLEKERERIASLLKNQGYFLFNKNYIVFEADSTIGNNQILLKEIIKDISEYDQETSQIKELPHSKFRVKEVNVYTNYEPAEALKDKSYLQKFSEIVSDGINIRYIGKQNITADLVNRVNKIRPNSLYNYNEVSTTYDNFSGLKIFRTINIEFAEVSAGNQSNNDSLVYFQGAKELICNIYLTPVMLQSYKLEGELYLSSDLWGLEGNVGYTHRNLFKGAEMFNINFNGSIDFLRNKKNADPINQINNSTEVGVTTAVYIPRFIFPVDIQKIFKAYSPQTQFSLGYNYQNRALYTRNLVNFGFGYSWMANKMLKVSYNPLNFNIIKMTNADRLKDYLQGEDKVLLATAFSDHFISSGTFSLTYNTQDLNNISSYYYAIFNVELAGNLLNALNPFLKRTRAVDSSRVYSIWGTPYSQFVETDFTIVNNQRLDSKNRLVYRFQVGVALPYGNSSALPYEKYFYVGGANSMRGWQVRTLGPGVSSPKDTTIKYIGDFKLEANMEYRFKIVWAFEGAFFFDVGNVWFLPRDKVPSNMTFRFDSFLKQIAVNTGVGLRLNLGYFIARLDMGIKMVDPSLPAGKRFVFRHFPTSRDLAFHFGIGYPF